MKLADKPCYSNMDIAYIAEHEKTINKNFMGLTFRERLIIALASNSKFVQWDDNDTEINVKEIIKQADAIIKQMEEK